MKVSLQLLGSRCSLLTEDALEQLLITRLQTSAYIVVFRSFYMLQQHRLLVWKRANDLVIRLHVYECGWGSSILVMAGGNEAAGSSLEVTPTWATAVTCSIIILVSLAVQRGIHVSGLWLKKRENRPLKNAFENIKEELMLLGVISLLLAVSQPFTSEICVSHSFIETMLPCKSETKGKSLLELPPLSDRRQLAAVSSGHCKAKGKTSILGANDIHDLHMFIFMLAVVHVFYSLLAIFLTERKINGWNKWEIEAHNLETSRTLEHHQEHRTGHNLIWHKALRFCASFFKQFVRSVTKADYLILRQAFVHRHGAQEDFDFHWYLKRSMADDFKDVVGISEYFWIFVIVFFLLNVHGWHTYFWISFIPISLLLILGAKLQHILGNMSSSDLKLIGEPIQLQNKIFWFGKPKVLLYLVHFTLFQNAFELALFFWIWATFGFNSCLLGNKGTAMLHIFTGVAIQVQCSYITLPLYALISQMGSEHKQQLLDERRQDHRNEQDMKQVDVKGKTAVASTSSSSQVASPQEQV